MLFVTCANGLFVLAARSENAPVMEAQQKFAVTQALLAI
jgi:hypothetical protein